MLKGKTSLIFKAILGFVGLAALGLGVKLGIGVYNYQKFNLVIPAKVVTYSVHAAGPEKFLIKADFSYKIEDRKYYGSHLFKRPVFMNEYAAKDHLKFWKTKTWEAFVCQKSPSQACLQKIFPVKSLIHFVLVCGVLLYFLYLVRYLSKIYGESPSS